MSFREDCPDYDHYQDGLLCYTKVPPAVVAPVKGLILRVAESVQHLKMICNDVASRIPCEPTQHRGWDYLVNDLEFMLDQLIRKKLYKFMDFIHDLVRDCGSVEFVEDLNNILNMHHFGYRMILDDSDREEGYQWDIHKEPE